jgi:methylmalonyl-CoA mutase N-terminal domain/subunit
MSIAEDRTPAAGRPLYRPEDAQVDYPRDLGDPGEYPLHARVATGAHPGGGAPSAQLIRELSGEGRAARSNEQFQSLLAHGATGLDVIGDAPTLASMDPDHPFGAHSVGNRGVSLCRAAHWEELYAGLSLDQVSVSHSLPPAFGVAGFYLAAKRLGWDPKLLRGSMITAPLFSEDTCYSHNVPMPRGSRDRLPSAGAELERSA